MMDAPIGWSGFLSCVLGPGWQRHGHRFIRIWGDLRGLRFNDGPACCALVSPCLLVFRLRGYFGTFIFGIGW